MKPNNEEDIMPKLGDHPQPNLGIHIFVYRHHMHANIDPLAELPSIPKAHQ